MNKFEVGLDQAGGVKVMLTINGRALDPISYDTANQLAVLLRGYGKLAKQNAGDLSLKVIGFPNLTDAVTEELRIQRRRDGTAAFRA